MVQCLVEKGVNVNINNIFQPIIWACQEGYFEIVKYLVEKGANVNKEIQFNPLHNACKHGHL